tara:strand:- start:1374 stop:1625 length:252 start_codon:yes stop_codon:yes gene_type:complete
MHIITSGSTPSLTPFEQASFNALCLADGLSYISTMARMVDILQGLDMEIDTARANNDCAMADQIEKTQTLLLASYITGYASEA